VHFIFSEEKKFCKNKRLKIKKLRRKRYFNQMRRH
jgi:hypothetical protein